MAGVDLHPGSGPTGDQSHNIRSWKHYPKSTRVLNSQSSHKAQSYCTPNFFNVKKYSSERS